MAVLTRGPVVDRRARVWPAWVPRGWRAARALLLAVLVVYFYVAAAAHADRVNLQRVRADQSGYLWDAVAVHGNWWNDDPPVLIGERNRMPVYPGFLALFYDPAYSPDEFFAVAKRIHIRLSLVLLAIIYLIVSRYLPPLSALNLIIVVGFGYFVFKAGYTQAELPLYFFVFVTFLVFAHLLRTAEGRTGVALAALGGTLAGVAHLTKASVLPLVGLFLMVYAAREVGLLGRGLRTEAPARAAALRRFGWRAAAALTLAACFLGVLYPYISTSKRVFGRYFYNVNTTFYVWYDDWPAASMGTYQHGDGVGWPKMPRSEIPTMRKYLATRSPGQIAARFGNGFKDMVTGSYTHFWLLKPLSMYLAFAAVLALSRRRDFVGMLRERAALFAFMALYAGFYLPAIAFYQPISGTTSRMLYAHMLPLLFVLSYFFARAPFRDHTWTLGGVTLTVRHFHVLVLVTMLLDLVFGLWPRLMTTSGGF